MVCLTQFSTDPQPTESWLLGSQLHSWLVASKWDLRLLVFQDKKIGTTQLTRTLLVFMELLVELGEMDGEIHMVIIMMVIETMQCKRFPT